MASQTLKNQKILMQGYDLTGQSNAIGFDYGAEVLDATVLGNDTRARAAGLKDTAISIQGFYDAAAQDIILMSDLGVADAIVSILDDDAEGSRAYFLQSVLADYSVGEQAGNLLRFQCNVAGDDNLVRGVVLGDGMNAAKTSSADLAAQQLGAVAAGEKFYAGLHVFGVGGTSPQLDVVIESDVADDFSGSETERITFDPVTAIGAQFKTVNGAITDTWWRAALTIAGTSPSFSFGLVAGIR